MINFNTSLLLHTLLSIIMPSIVKLISYRNFRHSQLFCSILHWTEFKIFLFFTIRYRFSYPNDLYVIPYDATSYKAYTSYKHTNDQMISVYVFE